MVLQPLSEQNVRMLGGKTLTEQQDELYKKMQTISELLGQVDAALADEKSTLPPPTAGSRPPLTAASSRPPPTGRSEGKQPPPTSDSVAAQRSRLEALEQQFARARQATGAGTPRMPTTGERPPTGLSGHSSAHSRNDPPQLLALNIHEDVPQAPKVELVQYTGQQSMLGGIQSRRRAGADSAATRSEMSSLLHWAAAPQGSMNEHRRPGAVKNVFTRT